jgi:hypothetical protein
VMFAAAVALAPWHAVDVGYPPVVHFVPPAGAPPHG